MAHNVIDIANKIVCSTDTERGDTISNLKLQKLLYYMQGYWLAFFNKPLFNEDIIAWMYGPVVKEAYSYFKEYGSASIDVTKVNDPDIGDFSDEEWDLFNSVLIEYGQFSAVKLMDMTHNELPWRSTPINEVISHKLMKDFFETQVEYA